MAQPVVSSRFGRRPILEVPAMALSNHDQVEVTSLEAPMPGYVRSAPPPTIPTSGHHPAMLGPGVYQGMPHTVPAPVHWPQGPYDLPYNAAPGVHPSQVAATYPGVAHPYGYQAPPPVPRYVSDPGFRPGPHHGFNITCDLEYGRIVNINVRDSHGEFQGIPPFLRDELVRTYGRFPFTQVKVRLEGGEFHIYASTHDRPIHHDRQNQDRRRLRTADDAYSDTYYEANSARFRNNQWADDDEESDGIRPRDDMQPPRGITHEAGWDAYRGHPRQMKNREPT